MKGNSPGLAYFSPVLSEVEMNQIRFSFSIFKDQQGVRLALHQAQDDPSGPPQWGPAPLSKPFENLAELENRLTSLGLGKKNIASSGCYPDHYSLTEEQLMQLNFEPWAISQLRDAADSPSPVISVVIPR